jgi:hypothetical protein
MAAMSVKKLVRMGGDILDMLGRGQLIWQLLTLTTAGQLVLAALVGAGIFSIAVIRSDPWISAIIFALSAFAVVAVVVHVVFRLNSRPKLEYRGVTGVQFEFGHEKFGTEEGGFMWGASFLRPLLVRVANIQQAIDIAANNANALIHYEHHDRRDKLSAQAVWATVGRRGGEFLDRIQIESGQVALLVLLYEYPPTPNQAAPGAKRTNDFLASGNLFPGSHYKKFNVGHWNVLIEVKSDNSAPLLLKGGFTIMKDERLKLDVPALRRLGTSSAES